MARVLVFAMLAGCSVPSLDVEGKPCPCPSGLVCDQARDVCVRSLTPDAHAMPDVALDHPPSSCGGFDLCDQFEAASFDAAWTHGAGITLDTAHAHSGAQSVHIHRDMLAMGQTGYTQIGESKTFASSATNPPVWVRAWFYLSALPAGTNHFELISIEQDNGGEGDYTFVSPTDTQIYSQFSSAEQGAGRPVPTNAWFCLVFEVVRDTGNAGQLVLTSDSLTSATIPATQTDATVPIHDVWLGVGFAGSAVVVAQPAFDLWVDDVIVHHAAVSCSD